MSTKYKVEYSQTKTSKCQGCQQHIQKGEIRVGTLTASGATKNYFHARCMSKGALLTDFVGLNTLSPNDEAQVRMWILEDNMAAQTRKRAETELAVQTKKKQKTTPKKQKTNPFLYTPPLTSFPGTSPFKSPPPPPSSSSSSSSHAKSPPPSFKPPEEVFQQAINELIDEATKEYKTTNDTTTPLEARYQTCLKALRLYSEAHDMASVVDMRVGVRRNMGMVAYKAASLSLEKKDLGKTVHHMQASIHHLSSAVDEGSRIPSRTREWQKTIEDKIIAGMDLIKDNTDTKTSPDRISALLQIGSHMTAHRLLNAELNYKLAVIVFNEAVSMQDAREWNKSKGRLGAMTMYCSEAMRFCRNAADEKDSKEDAKLLMTWIEDLENRKHIHECIAESRGLTAQADEEFNKQVFNEEYININRVWDIMDNYKQAALLTRELDTEGEAIALSRIGKIYNKIFKIKEKAHMYFRRSLDLAFSVQPRDLSSNEWFQEAQNFLSEYQNEQLAEEQRKLDVWKQPFLEKLKDKLDAIKAANKSTEELLQFIYSTHPPGSHSLPAEESTEKKLVQAIVHYHAEELKENSDEQKVFYGEIAKMLNARHENVKNVN